MDSLDTLIILKSSNNILIKRFILLVTILLLLIAYILFSFNYQSYYETIGIIAKVEDNYYLVVYNDINKNKYLTNNNYLIINEKKYSYDIEKIETDIQVQNQINYQLIYLNINLEEKYQLENLILYLKIPQDDKPIIKYLL